jgi:hypothetical protein
MRWRRAAAFVRGIGWAIATVVSCSAAAATFVAETPDALATFAVSTAVSLTVIAVAHVIGRVLDRRGERLVTR